MALFWKCANCENKSWFFKKSYDGLCENCHIEKTKNKKVEETVEPLIEQPTDDANSFEDVKADSVKPNFKVLEDLIAPLDVFRDSLLVYNYTNCEVCILNGTEQEVFANDFDNISYLSFDAEPENSYDPSAVVIKYDSKKIGYVYKGMFQDMINDWLERDHIIMGYISEIDYVNHKIFYQLSFYKPFDLLDHKTFPLTKMKSKDWLGESRYDNATSLEVGDTVSINFNGVDSPCIVEHYSSEVGELGQTAKEYINLLISKNREVVGVVEETDYDDNLNFKCKISIYNRKPI